MVCEPAALNTTVLLVEPSVPSVGLVVFEIVSVAELATSIVPDNAEPDGIVNELLLVPSPKTTFELLPETVQAEPIVAPVLVMLKT